MLAGGALASILRLLRDLWIKRKRAASQNLWRRHVDFSVVQACILTTEHLQTLGRIEKRTLFVKPIAEVFKNEYILERLLEQAEKAAASHDPMLVTQLSHEDKWHVLNTCSNHISSLFAPYHVFFNEARRVESYYKSAWYCFTLTCAQTSASGRWFITPFKPVGKDDVGMLRIRIVMMNEQELREVASGVIEAPSFGFLNGRHEERWKVIQRFAELFNRQLSGGESVSGADSGPNLCGRPSTGSRKRGGSNPRLESASNSALAHPRRADINSLAASTPSEPKQQQAPPDPQDNSILRIHVPFPASHFKHTLEDNVCQDVVLYE
ncbi:unnamed protein product [Polarella glacialis]|uniref:Uncharacterized protein n=1 Tax=Polarella glacialis TaxID=89957 RepID=A0A813LRJ9_POLGL|nr:unnamed protein product [Polarella glacialis]CAE8741514.1 unnamed protein product [Polarella glacialis]